MDEEEKMDLMKLTVRALAWSRPLSRGWSSHCSPLDNVSFKPVDRYHKYKSFCFTIEIFPLESRKVSYYWIPKCFPQSKVSFPLSPIKVFSSKESSFLLYHCMCNNPSPSS